MARLKNNNNTAFFFKRFDITSHDRPFFFFKSAYALALQHLGPSLPPGVRPISLAK